MSYDLFAAAQAAFLETDYYKENVKHLVWSGIVAGKYLMKNYVLFTGEEILVRFYIDVNFLVFHPE